MKYGSIASVNFQGMVIAFARGDMPVADPDATGLATNIYFNVLALNVDSRSDADDWSGFRPLRLPDAVRPAGMNMINVPPVYAGSTGIADLQDANQPFRVLTNQEYIYLFRQSVKGSLLVNRLRLVRETNPANPQETGYTLQPAWEVRYQRSGKPDTPADARDSQDYLAPDREPFIEPAFELFMVAALVDGNFDVQFLPRAEGTQLSCAVCVANTAASKIDIYELPLDHAGLFTLAGKTFSNGVIAPDFSFALQDKDGATAALSGAPAAVFYLKQEHMRGKDGAAFSVKRTGRVLLAQNVTFGTKPLTFATVDLAVAGDGTMARPAPGLVADPVGVANYTLKFDAAAYVGLDDWVVPDQYSIDLWIYPQSPDIALQQILGDLQATGAPWIRLVDGTAIEAGFKGKNGELLAARTAPGSVRQSAWTHVQVSFDQTFTIKLNGFDTPCTVTGTGDTPAATPVNAVSAPVNGFIGCVDQLCLYAGALWQPETAVSLFAFDSIDYLDQHLQALVPPITPNSKKADAPGKVYGAHLIPSTSPVAESAGALSWDARGLSIYAAYFDNFQEYAELHSAPCLLAGSDGLVHYYFRGGSDAFSAMRLDTATARAVFEGDWQTAQTPPETGRLQFVASQAGAFMNSATVTVARLNDPVLDGLFCDVTLVAPSGVTETWQGVPRSVLPFCAVMAGNTANDPADPRVQNYARTYFDTSGTRSAAYLPLEQNAGNAALALVSRSRTRLPLAAAKVDASGDDCVLTLRFGAPRWGSAEVTATWDKLPRALDAFLNTVAGLSTSYVYTSKEALNIDTYSLAAGSGLVAANRVVLFVKPQSGDLEMLQLTQGSNQNLCNVSITLGGLSATWTEVPRAQVLFGTVLEGAAQDYNYAELAQGNYADIGAALIIYTDGTEAMLLDATLGGTAPAVPDDDLRVSAALFAAFATERPDAGALVSASGAGVAASTFQRATGSGDATLDLGSTLFRAMPLTLPTQGAAALVQDTSTSAAGIAPLTLQGYNGGWLNQPEQRTLTYDGKNYVGVDASRATNPGIDALAIRGDMSLELWCRPDRSAQDFLQPFQRLLTFNCPAPGTDVAVQYMAGLADCPSLAVTAGTRVRTGFDSDTGTWYGWINPDASGAGVIGSVSTLGNTTPILTLALDAAGHVTVVFALDTSQAAIVSKAVVAAGTWHQVAVGFTITRKTVNFKYEYTINAWLTVDSLADGSATYTTERSTDLPIQMVTMVIGDIVGTSGLPMRINETAFFARLLDSDEYEEFFEQRVADNADGLVVKWNLLTGTGTRAINSAMSGASFDADITPTANWNDDGLYAIPILGHGNNIATLAEAPVIHGWAHLALVHQSGYAIALQGRDYADCGADAGLGLGDAFSLETWVQPGARTANAAQTILAKGAEYVLSLNTSGQPVFAVQVTIDDVQQSLTITGPDSLTPGRTVHLAARFAVRTTQVAAGDKLTIAYEAHLDLFINGVLAVWGMQADDGKTYRSYTSAIERVYGNAALNLGRSPLLQGTAYLLGKLADVRLWSRLLGDDEIALVYASRRVPANADGLVAWWHFDETAGRVAFDAKGNNNATLSNGNLRQLFDPTTTNSFYVNGQAAARPVYVDAPAAVGGYGTSGQFYFATMGAGSGAGFYGRLADVRIWNTQLTGEQITDGMYRPLAGNEPTLRGYWNFGNGSGTVVEDRTGRGNAGTLAGPTLPAWQVSTAPLSDESPEVLNVFGGVPTYAQHDISERPSVIEYADLQRDAYGNPFSVMKRAYLSVHGDTLRLQTGFMVGDLDTVYLGQAQSKPTLIGYIEGAPPVPAENQTLPYWLGGYGERNTYAGASDVTFTDAENTVYAYNAGRDTSDTHAFSMKGGLYGGGQYATSAGIGIEVETPVMVFEGHLGAQGGFTLTDHQSDGIGVQAGMDTTLATGLKPGGTWEPGENPSDWVNPVVGRRYLPNNNGLALVKSLTVDVYASILRRTGSMVKMSMAPNPDIPADVNLIDFPIDPRYIKNGTLDGKVGLRNDPDYPDADLQRGSYFKPVEAYAIKRRIEHDQTALEAYYQQYDPGSFAGKLKSASSYADYRNTMRNNNGYDWSDHLSRRSIVNTYVWTAGGGTFAEQNAPMNVYSEQHGAISSTEWSIGAVGDIQMAFPVAGFYLDFDYLYSSATEVNVVKSKEETSGFALTAEATPDSYLYAPVIDGPDVTFGASPAEGKVNGYRYMAFMLAPTPGNGDAFFHTVIDPNWLANSKDANAAALRDASAAAAGPWRVLYRVTYVSRIPPKFQPVPAETQAPDLRPPANQGYNALLVQLVQAQIKVPQPDALAIGTAIGAVLGTPATPGVLDLTLPWWRQFMADTLDYTLPAGAIVRALREDLLQYMVALYATADDGGF